MNRKLTAATLVLAVGPLVTCAVRAEDESKSLYDRLGGLRSITPLVEDFVDHLYANPAFDKNPTLSLSRRRTPSSYLKFQFAQLVCEMSGGPCVYAGMTMKEAHEPLKISAAEWDAMAAELKASLDKFKVAPADQTELLELFDQTKGDIMENMEVASEKAD